MSCPNNGAVNSATTANISAFSGRLITAGNIILHFLVSKPVHNCYLFCQLTCVYNDLIHYIINIWSVCCYIIILCVSCDIYTYIANIRMYFVCICMCYSQITVCE